MVQSVIMSRDTRGKEGSVVEDGRYDSACHRRDGCLSASPVLNTNATMRKDDHGRSRKLRASGVCARDNS